MATNPIITGATLAAGVQSNFMNTYAQEFDGVAQNLGDVMDIGIPTIFRTTPYAYRRTMPYPTLWQDGAHIPTEATDALRFTATARDYAVRVEWNRNDRADNQVGDLRADANNTARNFASIDSRAFFEILVGTPILLPAIPNAPDGSPIFSATAEGGNRFGVSGGNIVTGTTMTTSQEVQALVFLAIARFGQFLNTKGQPFFEPNLGGEAYTVYAPNDKMEIFTQAFAANVVMQSPAATAAAGVSNVILASGMTIRLVFADPTTRIPGNNFFVFRNDAPHKAIGSLEREPIRTATATEENSDESRNTKKEYVQWATRRAHFVNQPFGAVKVTWT